MSESRIGNTVGNLWALIECHDCLTEIRLRDSSGELKHFDIREDENGTLIIFECED